MIARITGRLLEKHPSRAIVDVSGVGYDVQIPLSTFYNLGEPGTDVALRVHTHVREDALALFGFATPLELQLFERLIGVNGVGPKLALAVLSGIEPPDLVRAIRAQDVSRLTKIPGIGKKTAERISLELRDKLPASLAAAESASPAAAGDALRDDLISALLNLGYQPAVAEKAVGAVVKDGEEHFDGALKKALKTLVKR
ncbi:MAG: Holliday junction branch migration protein RuvA [Vicinamibacterales bacterium]